MIEKIKKILFIVATISSVFILMKNQNHSNQKENIQIVKNITIKDGEAIIKNQYLFFDNLEKSDQEIVYTIVQIDVKRNVSLQPLMIKNGHPFYVFQNNHLIYSQEKNTFYQGKSLEETKYYFANIELWKNQVLHKIPIHSQEPIYILIQKEKNKQISDFITRPKLNTKNIQKLTETNIPVIKINTHNNSLDTTKYTHTYAQIISNKSNKSILSKMKIRGNTSLSFPKKQFNIVFEEKNKLNQLDLKKNVLISFYSDRSLMRNKIAHDLFSLFKSNESISEYVHLIINDIYEGLYIITDHPEQQFNKLISDTKSLKFLAQIDRGPFDVYSDIYKTGYNLKSIDNIDKITEAINSFEKLVKNQVFEDEVSGYKIDINSFIDFIILNELSKNIDAYRLSTYLSFIDKKISIDVVWDFDLTFGLADYNEGYNHQKFLIESDIREHIPSFWKEIWDNKIIKEKLKKRYTELRESVLSNESIDNYINNLYNEINISAELNFERWKIIGEDVWPNKFNFKSYKEEVYYVKDWIYKRLQFLDSKWN